MQPDDGDEAGEYDGTPTVSRRALPEGKRLGSTRFTARLVKINVTFDIGSKIESAIVVNKDREPEERAP